MCDSIHCAAPQSFSSEPSTYRDQPYFSQSPSPVDALPSSSYPHSTSTPPVIEHDRPFGKYSSGNIPHFADHSFDQRRISKPTRFAATNPHSSRIDVSHRSDTQSEYVPRSSAYVHSLQRGIGMSSLRSLPHSHVDYPNFQPSNSGWNHDDHHCPSVATSHSIPPLQPNFSSNLDPYGTGVPYSPNKHDSRGVSLTYYFVALPDETVKKRPRRLYGEIERLYQCSWSDCNKGYGTLNHLNAHIKMQKHGPKRHPNGKIF
ncbi:hypothetical protein C0991_009381 [Blastosporella zonata]|nr:hypothetical protein C0991_009381 [Blastosporella zonata]